MVGVQKIDQNGVIGLAATGAAALTCYVALAKGYEGIAIFAASILFKAGQQVVLTAFSWRQSVSYYDKEKTVRAWNEYLCDAVFMGACEGVVLAVSARAFSTRRKFTLEQLAPSMAITTALATVFSLARYLYYDKNHYEACYCEKHDVSQAYAKALDGVALGMVLTGLVAIGVILGRRGLVG